MKWILAKSFRKGMIAVLTDDERLLVTRVRRLTQDVVRLDFEDGTWQLVGAGSEYQVIA